RSCPRREHENESTRLDDYRPLCRVAQTGAPILLGASEGQLESVLRGPSGYLRGGRQGSDGSPARGACARLRSRLGAQDLPSPPCPTRPPCGPSAGGASPSNRPDGRAELAGRRLAPVQGGARSSSSADQRHQTADELA